MTGRIVYQPDPEADAHRCDPPWRPDMLDGPQPLLRPASVSETKRCAGHSMWTAGTVWRCDCGRVWVTRHETWMAESRWSRWRRERRLRRGDGRVATGDPGRDLEPGPSPRPTRPDPSVSERSGARHGGYASSSRPASDLAPPPSGPAPGAAP